jgi:MFS-type transporter involved in bile tolerance (Atg22 family)
MVTYGAVLNMALMGYQAVQIVFLVRTVGVSAATVGALVMAGSLGGILGALLATAVGRRFGSARGMLVRAFMVATGVAVCNVVVGSFRQRYCPPGCWAGWSRRP